MSLLDAIGAAIEARDPHSVRALDRALAAWVLQHTGSDALAAAAFALSVAEGQGHVCLDLTAGIDEIGIAPLPDDARAAVRAQPWVASAGAADAMPQPFVLTADDRLYTRRWWRHEGRLAAALAARAALAVDADPQQTESDLDVLFRGADPAAVAGQRAAIATALRGRLLVLSGGPGTGKTTTVLRLLLALLRQRARCGLPAQPAIRLAAPTGKAAQRLADALREGVRRLAATLPDDWRACIDAVPIDQAYTLHRLLGYEPWQDRYRHSAWHPLPADIVVVDEASMVDLAQMSRLFDALRPSAFAILLGDPEQLHSVAAGSVLHDIVTADAPALQARVAGLTHVFRSSGELPDAWQAIRRGDGAALSAALARGTALARCDADDAARLLQCLQRWWQAPPRQAMLAALHDPAATPAAALAALRGNQLLCALRDGPFGAFAVNEWVDAHVRRQYGIDAQAAWYHGRPVLVTRNDAERGLFNGDLGVALHGPDGLQVWFDAVDADGVHAPRALPPHALPACDPAYALTVHKSQGSEYAHVAVLLPPDPAHRVLSRQLVYTAATRAQQSLELWASDAVLAAALARSTRRQGGLPERLRGAG